MSEIERLIDEVIAQATFVQEVTYGSDADKHQADQLLAEARAALLSALNPEREARRDAVIAAARALLDEADPDVRDGYWMIDDGAHWALHRALLALGADPASQATPPVVTITLTDDEHLVLLDALVSHLDGLAETKRDLTLAMRLYQRLGAEPVDRASAAPAAGDGVE